MPCFGTPKPAVGIGAKTLVPRPRPRQSCQYHDRPSLSCLALSMVLCKAGLRIQPSFARAHLLVYSVRNLAYLILVLLGQGGSGEILSILLSFPLKVA